MKLFSILLSLQLGSTALAEPVVIDQVPSESQADLAIERLIRRELGSFYNRTNYQMVSRWASYQYNLVDLNGDKSPEALVLLSGAYECGTGGCTAFVLTQKDKKWKVLTRLSLVKDSIGVSEERTQSWRDLLIKVSGGGIVPHWRRLTFDGKTYPSNPTVKPATPLQSTPKTTLYWQKGPAFKIIPR